MPTILLIRHCENDYVRKRRLAGRLAGIHLNQNGQRQAQELANALKDASIKAVYSSPLERAIETAKPIANAHNLKVVQRAGLLEVDIGKWQDRTIKQVRRTRLWKIIQDNPALARFPAGESFAEAQLRISSEIESLVAMHASRDVIICVSHSDMIKLAVSYFLGLSLDLFQRITVDPGSISTLQIGKSAVRLLNLNHHSVLAPKP